MRVKFLAQGKQQGPLMGLELTTDRYPPITSQTRYPLRHASKVNTCIVEIVDPLAGKQSKVQILLKLIFLYQIDSWMNIMNFTNRYINKYMYRYLST